MDDLSPQSPQSPPLTLGEVLKLHDGLTRLEGTPEKDGRTESYDFGAALGWTITKSIVTAEREAQAYNRRRTALGKTFGVVAGMTVTEANAGNIAAFIAADDELKDQPSLALTAFERLPLKALQKAGVKNPVLLAKLFPIIEDV